MQASRARIILESRTRTVCSGIKTGHRGKLTGLTVETAERSEGQKYTSEVKWPSGPPRGPCCPRAQCVSPRGRSTGASPAGLSAAIFPLRLEFFPAGGVAPTPAAGLVAGPVGGGRGGDNTSARAGSSRLWFGPGRATGEEVTKLLFVV